VEMKNDIAPESNEVNSVKNDITKVLDRISHLETVLRNLKQNKATDDETIEKLKEDYENLKTENFNLTLDNHKLQSELTEYKEQLTIHKDYFTVNDQIMENERNKTTNLVNDLVKYEEVFKTFAEAIKPEDIEEEDSSLSVLNTKLLEEKENLLEEISKLKSNLRKAEANANKQKDLSIPEYRDLDNKYYQTTLDTINKFEEKVEILNEEKEKLGQEKTDLRKRVKELEDYIRNVSNKIIVEPAEPKETKKDPKNKKQANQIPIEESE